MIISHKHKFIFIANGKTGTTSIEQVLDPFSQSRSQAHALRISKHAPARLVREKVGKAIWEEYFTFGFVRYPYDWVLSQYLYNAKQFFNGVSAWVKFREKIRMKMSNHLNFRTLSKGEKYTAKDIQFLHSYLSEVFSGLPHEGDANQTHMVFDRAMEQPLLDFIGQFENLDQDFQHALNRIGLEKIDLPQTNVSKNRKADPTEMFDNSALAEIRKLWAIDFETFDYIDSL